MNFRQQKSRSHYDNAPIMRPEIRPAAKKPAPLNPSPLEIQNIQVPIYELAYLSHFQIENIELLHFWKN